MDIKKAQELNEKKVVLPVTLLEAALLLELRKHPYNKITVYSTNGHPVRVVGENSILLNENEALEQVVEMAKGLTYNK